jgi:hypothetical protein
MLYINDDYSHMIKKIPKFELSYETIIHKKVYDSDILLAIPEGIKCFAWFTFYNDENVCFIIEFSNNQFRKISICLTGFNDVLSYGTILYGTLFKYNGFQYFCVEDIYYNKGVDCSNELYSNKLKILQKIFNMYLSQVALNNNYVIFGLPLIHHNFNEILKKINHIPYKISQIQFRYYKSNKIFAIKYFKPGNKIVSNQIVKISEAIFKVTPDIQNDIYNLHVYKNGSNEFYDIAHIPDYKTSVMMNKLFRNIKENKNLDALEESDDEEEFENEKLDKYVFLNKSFKMKCSYNIKFKKWVPICLANRDDKIVNPNLLKLNQ